MCLKRRPPWPMPEETRRIGKSLLEKDDPYRLIGEQLFEKLNDEEFADLYSSEGKLGFSPVILAFVSVFQFMERLADRQAAQPVNAHTTFLELYEMWAFTGRIRGWTNYHRACSAKRTFNRMDDQLYWKLSKMGQMAKPPKKRCLAKTSLLASQTQPPRFFGWESYPRPTCRHAYQEAC